MTPNLGLATNEEMLRELICRFKMEQYTNGSDITVHKAIERALTLSEMVGGMSAPEREYSTVGFTETIVETRTSNKFPIKKTPKKTPKKRGPYATKAQRQERDEKIMDLFVQSYSFAEIAAQFGLSQEYVRQIVMKYKALFPQS